MNALRAYLVMILCALLLGSAGISAGSQGKVPQGYRDIQLGMTKTQVLDLLKKGPIHFSFDERGEEIGEIVRGDELFRYANYRFDREGILIEIGLQMREILGRDRVLELYNKQQGLNLAPLQRTQDANVSIEVRDNVVIMQMDPGKDKRSAQAKDTKP
jgi:hypothetical protein